MTRFEVLPFKPDDYVVAVGDSYPWLHPRTAGENFYTYGPAFTGWIDGQIAGCAGIVIHWPGVGHAWAHVTDLGRAHPLFTHRVVVRGLRRLIREHNLVRVEADVIAEWAMARAWIETLGFKHEYTAPKAAPNGDLARYAWVKED